MDGRWQRDKILRQKLGIITVPNGPGATTSSTTILAGTARTFVVTTIPDSPALSLWNFYFSIVIDSTAQDANFQFLNIYRGGPGLNDGQRKTRIYQWLDWATSSDATNRHVHNIMIENNDTVDHTYYLYYKGYTTASNPGSAG